MACHERCPDEESPLLQTRSKTPLPWGQLSLVFLALLAEPLSSAYIFPFVNQLVGELGVTGGDDRKIGYYAGLIESLFFITQAFFTWRWSRLSDSIGRRPVILLGLLGLSVSNFAFGLSRSLSTLIISRCIAGMLNGNVGVMRSIIGDITDHTNMARAFAVIPAIFSIGGTIALLYGGALVKPQERWPDVFHDTFWARYPYFLPSFMSGCLTLFAFLLCAAFLKESLPSKAGSKPKSEGPANGDILSLRPKSNEKPIPMMTLLKTYSVMISVANFGILALVEISFFVLVPLFYSSSIAIGGLGFTPSVIGIYMAVFGALDGVVQALFAPRSIEWMGPKRLFCLAVLWFYPLILNFPLMSVVVTTQGKVGPIMWILLVLQLIFMVFMDLSYAVISVFVTRAAPSKQSLGATNGLGQSAASIARAIGPVLTTSLFAVSKEYNVLGGNLVYVILVLLTTILVLLSRRLPDLKDEE